MRRFRGWRSVFRSTCRPWPTSSPHATLKEEGDTGFAGADREINSSRIALKNSKPGGYQQGRVDQSIADVRRHTQRWQDVVDIAWGDNPEWLDSEPGLYLAHGPDGISGALFYPSHLFNR